MGRLTRDGTAEPVSRDQILRHARGQGNIHFPCSADHEQDWQPYPVDPYSAICDDHTYTYVCDDHTISRLYVREGKILGTLNVSPFIKWMKSFTCDWLRSFVLYLSFAVFVSPYLRPMDLIVLLIGGY